MSLRPSILLAATVLTTGWLPQLSYAQEAANPAVPGPSPQTSPVQPGAQQPPLLSPGPLPLPEEEGPTSGGAPNPNTPRHYSFEEASISRIFRLLAKQAGIDYIEPPINPGEKISFELSNVTPLQAFEILAQRRGFRVVQNNGIYELVRDDLRNPNHDTVYVTRTYQLRNVDAHLVVEGVANLLGMEVKTPEGITKGFPKPNDISAVSSLSSGSGSGGGSDAGGNQSEGKFTSGFPLASATAKKQGGGGGGGGGGDQDQKEYLFTDRDNV
ncbi:MAG: hypothetical protein JOY92_04835, partial [Verrucomicrobia bacterium]|nr:hypothetical protein [Verrucomicrobiota bacterium]